ncbi:uncharacterized protein B0H18DRAFT_1115140 [Fomitopsis serialis]|uniref:uncharacterized protein n=1 Tax=Fomitopsis serialis TaxID=139415 RepID=UPI00200856AB|nr:uncharacterized protein B0H18DRAFT_1115140 [Neoantrodia serialis]KAH9933759.1 hypothetical protein B0H18DRAFT_1115140 [Neoantrodia serialis]
MAVWAFVDGRGFPYRTHFKAGYADGEAAYMSCDKETLPLLFADVHVTDDENAASTLSDASQLDVIQILVFRIRSRWEVPYKHPTGTGALSAKSGPIHETAKKGGMHCIEFGATWTSLSPMYFSADYVDNLSSPYITFNFRYRPSELLQVQGITQPPAVQLPQLTYHAKGAATAVPRTLKKATSSGRGQIVDERCSRGSCPTAGDFKLFVVKVEVEDDEADLKVIRAQLRTLQEQLDRIENNRSQSNRSVVTKREPSPVRVGNLQGNVIDLTED